MDAKIDNVSLRTEAALAETRHDLETKEQINGKVNTLIRMHERTEREVSSSKWWLMGAAVTLLLGPGALSYASRGELQSTGRWLRAFGGVAP